MIFIDLLAFYATDGQLNRREYGEDGCEREELASSYRITRRGRGTEQHLLAWRKVCHYGIK